MGLWIISGIIAAVVVYFMFKDKGAAHKAAFKNFIPSHPELFTGKYKNLRASIVHDAEKVFFEKLYNDKTFTNPDKDVALTIFYATCGSLATLGKMSNVPVNIGTMPFMATDNLQQFGGDILTDLLKKKLITIQEFDVLEPLLLDATLKAAGTDLQTMRSLLQNKN